MTPAIPNYDADVLAKNLSNLSQPSNTFTTPWYQFLSRIRGLLLDAPPVALSRFEASFNGRNDDTVPFQRAINQVVAQGGGVILLDKPGTLSINSVFTPAGNTPIWITGLGPGVTTVKRRDTLAPGSGLIDISGSNVTLSEFAIDGGTTVPRGLQYGVDFNGIGGNDPMSPVLTNNTSVWVHGNTSMLSFQRMMFTHAAGYLLLLDAMQGDVTDIDVLNCFFVNNYPFLFGTDAAHLIYGSWGGGLFAKGDGRTSGSGVVRNLLVSQCRWKRALGNCCWQHLYGLNRLHENIRITDCFFEDTGLDGVLMGGVSGGVVSGNVFHRVGYTVVDDTSPSVPRWLANVPAVALDSAGLVRGVNYECNTFRSVNGGCVDIDSHGQSSISGNLCIIPRVGESDYVADSIAITGPNNNSSNTYGVSLSNSSQSPEGAIDVNIGDNTFINLSGGSIRLYAARNCYAHGNIIDAPDAPVNPPIALGPIGPGPYQRCYNNRISDNHCTYSPPSGGTPLIFEDDTVSGGNPFTAGEKNYCFGNQPLLGNGNSVEFVKSPTSGSPVFAATTWFP